MNEDTDRYAGLVLDARVDRIERIHRDPPTEWDGKTAWIAVTRDYETILVECALVDCPECGFDRAQWYGGVLACPGCEQRQRLVG